MKKTVARLAMAGVLSLAPPWSVAADTRGSIVATERGALAETDRYRCEFRNGVLVSLRNKLTNEDYLDTGANPAAYVPHLPSGLGTQSGEPARAAAESLYRMPWYEHPNDRHFPNQHFADAQSRFALTESRVAGRECEKAELAYTGLTDGKERFTDETFTLTLEIDPETGDLLVTPGGTSPRPGVYAANLTLAPLGSAITAEAPIADGVRLTRQNTGQVLWNNNWPSYWQYGFLVLNGWKRGAVGIWAQDAKLRYYKTLFYLNNGEGLSFSFSTMNVPPFEELKEARSAVPWRIQAFDTSMIQAVERYRQWRDVTLKIAPRPEFTKQISFMASLSSSQEMWQKVFLRYTEPWQGRAAAFLCSIRGQSFDNNHADNTPYKGFKEDTAKWREAGTYGMAYLHPMIMWGPFPDEAKMANPEREKLARKLHNEADTRGPFQKDPDARIPYVDQHHLGHPGWQRWFLDWIHEWCKDYGAQGIYHDQSYPAPIDRRGLAIGGMTSPEGMADYFYKAATENPGTFHGAEMVNEANATVICNAIGQSHEWGTAPNMRLARVYESSPVTAALCSPHTVLWSFLRIRGNSTWDLRDRRMQEARGQIAGAIDGPYDWQFDPQWWPALCNVAWLDRTRDVTFMKHGLRPYYPVDFSRDVYGYLRGAEGEEFRYEKMPWGSRFVQIEKDGTRRPIYATATGVQAVPEAGFGIANWLVYNDDDPTHIWNRTGPAGLHPERWYVLDPAIKRPPVRFSTVQGYGPSLYESYAADSGYNESFAFLKLRTIGRLLPMVRWESLVLHSPTPPLAVYVNGKKSEVKLKDGTKDQYPMSVQAPADIVVMLKRPAAAMTEWSRSALLRVTADEDGNDHFRPEAISGQADGGADAQKRPVLNDAAVAMFGLYPWRKHLSVPLAAPEGGQGGVMRLHLPALAEAGRRWNHLIEAVEVNLQPVASATAPRPATPTAGTTLHIPETIDIPLAAGEIKLLTLRTLPLTVATDVARNTTRLAVEWLPKQKE